MHYRSSSFVCYSYQQYQIHRLNQTADAMADVAAQSSAEAKTKVDQLEKQLDRLTLITRAMYELFQEFSGLSDDMLAQKVTEIDLRDGTQDGQVTPQSKQCPDCDSMISVKFSRCLFCGYIDKSGDLFQSV